MCSKLLGFCYIGLCWQAFLRWHTSEGGLEGGQILRPGLRPSIAFRPSASLNHFLFSAVYHGIRVPGTSTTSWSVLRLYVLTSVHREAAA